ncbi:hypothetical protein LPJ78_005386 [Coemansia sp. RSA 989]|nr:hypothetical protein LPJ78_005386 [Coemansia sp. RSA 989]KAJ2646012.1 hypothetical protein IWW40_005713 [Coemansia sp. RSA 1250]KAJ2667832.1 hypothetical protein IWW42_005656 [Coemansia sp. RSA 1085]
MSQDDLEIVRRLVDVVARTFYDDEYVIALDYLNRHEIARIDVLGRHLRAKPNAAYIIYGELEKHRLVKRVSRMDEPAEAPMFQKRNKKWYFYIDYKQFVDVVKWRMHKLQEQVRSEMDKGQKNLGYDCERCQRRFTILEAVALLDASTGQFRCDYCGDELVDHTSLEIAQESQKEASLIMDQFKSIIDLLRQTDSITLPAPTPLSKVPVPDMDAMDGDGDGKGPSGGGKELGIARDTGAARGDTIIEFAPDLSSKEAARIRESELEKKLQQNALPPWHIWSSVSGVQMVPDQKITPEADLRHRRYEERNNIRKNRWNKRERERAKLALREIEEQVRSGTGGKRSTAEAGEDEAEANREAFYAKFYAYLAENSGIELPRDPREHYQKLLSQLAKNEELEKAEMEKRKQEMERIEKERKEAAAAAAAATTKGNDRNASSAFRYRNKYSQASTYNRFGKNNQRRRMTHRLFEFVGNELAKATASAADSDTNSNDAVVAADQDQGVNMAEDGASADDHSVKQNGTATETTQSSKEDDVPDPYLEGIYALSQAKRRKLGLDDLYFEPMPGAVAELPKTSIKVAVGGQPKEIALITTEDEDRMSTDEYIAYWNAWHKAQSL